MIKKLKNARGSFYLIQLSYTSPDGKRFQPKFRKDRDGNPITSKAQAEMLKLEYLNDLRRMHEYPEEKIDFQKCHMKFIEEIKLSMKLSTVMQYDGDLKKWLPSEFLSKPIKEITREDVRSLVFDHMSKKRATAHTQKRVAKNLRRIFQSFVDEGRINKNPVNGINIKLPPALKRVLNTSEAEKLLNFAKDCSHSFYHIWAFALLSGMRSGELYSLRWDDVDLERRIITIRSSWSSKDGYHSTKSNKVRILPISNDLKKLLLELLNIGPFSENLKGLNGQNIYFEDLVLPRCNEWRYGNQAQITKKFCEQIGITSVKFHDLRATFITNLLSSGVSLPKVMSIVGHSKTSTTDEYLRLAGVDINGSTESLGYKLPTLNPTQNLFSIVK